MTRSPEPRLLRPARLSDRRRAYDWLAHSDATASMMGPPDFPDHPAPTWEEFCADYSESFFTPEGDGRGRLFVIQAEGRDVGCISYDGLDDWRGIAELDVWIASNADHGRGYGSRALRELSDELLAHASVEALIIRPSARNERALAAYRKAGFVPLDRRPQSLPEWVETEGLDYRDTVVLVRTRA